MNYEEALSSHLQWKFQLRSFLATGKAGAFDICVAHLDDRCELGQWIYWGLNGHGQSDPDLVDLRAAHAAFHRHVGEIVQIGEVEPAKARLLLEGNTFMGLTAEITSCLHRLKQKHVLATHS